MEKIMTKYQDGRFVTNSEYQYSLLCRLNPNSNGGESICLNTHVFDSGDGPFTNGIEFTAICHGVGSVSIQMSDVSLKILGQAIEEIQKIFDSKSHSNV